MCESILKFAIIIVNYNATHPHPCSEKVSKRPSATCQPSESSPTRKSMLHFYSKLSVIIDHFYISRYIVFFATDLYIVYI